MTISTDPLLLPCRVCHESSPLRCRQCGRPACASHMVRLPEELVPIFGVDACSVCAEKSIEQVAQQEKQRARKREGDVEFRICSACGQEFPQVLPPCSVCGARVCKAHRLRYRKRFRFGNDAWYWDYDVRCLKHKRNPLSTRLEGWEVDTTTAETDDRPI